MYSSKWSLPRQESREMSWGAFFSVVEGIGLAELADFAPYLALHRSEALNHPENSTAVRSIHPKDPIACTPKCCFLDL